MRLAGSDGPAALARELARILGSLSGPLEAELWASHLHGELGLQAMELLDSANLWRRLPTWAADIGESEIVGAAVMTEPVFDDARSVFLESRYPDGETVAVGVLIDNNLGGLAKDVLLAESIDQVAAQMQAHAEDEAANLVLELIEPGVAAGLIGAGIAVTDATWNPPVDDDYWAGRALALLRADQTPRVVVPDGRPRLPVAERTRLREEFLGSTEGAAFAPDGDEVWLATMVIDFCADYVDGDPLRWSPVLVELFMINWIPRMVTTTDAQLAVLPSALEAWVRFAARKRELPDWALALTLAAIPEYAAEMVELASDPETGDA